MSATLVVRRDSDTDIKMRELEVFVDDRFHEIVPYGGTLEIPLPPGEHSVTVSNKLKKERAEFTVRDGETVVFEGANVLSRGLSTIFGALGMIVYHVTLRRVS